MEYGAGFWRVYDVTPLDGDEVGEAGDEGFLRDYVMGPARFIIEGRLGNGER